jgi:hypothetical protein
LLKILATGRDSETLINYLDQNLIVLKEKLNETNFERILSVIWESSAQSLSDTIQISIEVSIFVENLPPIP